MEMLAGQVAVFLEAHLPGRDVWLHVVPSPSPENRESHGTFAGSHFFMEITNETMPRDAAWVTLHELTHAMYEAAPPTRHRYLMEQFARFPDGQPFYALLNEALATAVQLIVFERLKIPDENPYNHPYIPRLGRSSLPLLKLALDEGATMFDGFAARYIHAGRAEIGDDAQNPRFRYSAVAVLASEKNQRASQAFLEAIQPTCATTSEADWKRYKGLPAVRLVTDGEPAPDDGAWVIRARDTDALVEAVRRLTR